LQVVIDVTNPWKGDYNKLGCATGPDCIVDVESKDADQVTKKSFFGWGNKGQLAVGWAAAGNQRC
jgi:hypothetical protein